MLEENIRDRYRWRDNVYSWMKEDSKRNFNTKVSRLLKSQRNVLYKTYLVEMMKEIM